jgi:RNA polymerase sigma factor (sigma-70 family)
MTAAEIRRQRLIEGIARDYREQLFRFIRSWVPTYEDAEDILQDVLYRLTASFDQIISLERAGAWLYTAVRNRISDFYRKQARRVDRDPAGPGSEKNEAARLLDEILPDLSQSPEQRFEREALGEAIIEALAKLPEEQREVFIWHEVEGLSFNEIAEITGAPINTLLSRKRYAIHELRKQLQALKPLLV